MTFGHEDGSRDEQAFVGRTKARTVAEAPVGSMQALMVAERIVPQQQLLAVSQLAEGIVSQQQLLSVSQLAVSTNQAPASQALLVALMCRRTRSKNISISFDVIQGHLPALVPPQ